MLPLNFSVPANVLFDCNAGTFVVSRLSVTDPVVPPPVNPVPAVTPVIVPLPVPGNVCPVANVRMPLLLILNPVSVGAVVPEPNSKLRLPDGVAVSLAAGSACSWNVCATAAPEVLLNEDATKSSAREFLPPVAIAAPVDGRIIFAPTFNMLVPVWVRIEF